jgi:septum site-determining protein MinC
VSGGDVQLFTIKGLKSGPTFLFNDQAAFSKVMAAVDEELSRANGFFRDSPVILHFGSRLIQREEWWNLKEILHREELLLRYAVATEQASRELLYKEGLPVRDNILPATSEPHPAPPTTPGGNALYLRRNLRSGQKQTFDGDLVLVGDINQGAEILAGGDVIVFGTVRGILHAGYPDNKGAVVIALNLIPLQLRIGPIIARAEDNPKKQRRVQQPEMACVKDEQIMILPYQRKL